MSLQEAIPLAFRDALIIIGALSVITGMLMREQSKSSRGLGMSLIVVGVMMVVAGPLGRMANWW